MVCIYSFGPGALPRVQTGRPPPAKIYTGLAGSLHSDHAPGVFDGQSVAVQGEITKSVGELAVGVLQGEGAGGLVEGIGAGERSVLQEGAFCVELIGPAAFVAAPGAGQAVMGAVAVVVGALVNDQTFVVGAAADLRGGAVGAGELQRCAVERLYQ